MESIPSGHQVIKNEDGGQNNIQRNLEKNPK
jgi:hypothetical protein